MKALILAAGRGSRMEALTDAQPKGLTELGERPLVAWQCRALTGAGLGPVGIVTGYRAEALQPFADHSFHNPDWTHTNMVASLACAGEWLAADTVIVSYSDIFYSSTTVRRLADCKDADIAISYDPHWLELWSARFGAASGGVLGDAESFSADANGNLLDIGRTVQNLDEVQGQYMGLLRITPAGWAQIETVRANLAPEARDRLDMTTLLLHLLGQDMRIRVVPNDAVWGEIDNPTDLALYTRWLEDGRLDLEWLTRSLRVCPP